jgi:hypothetical protein
MSVPPLPMGPGGMIEVPEEMQDGVSRLVDMSVVCRYLAAQCQVCPTVMLGSPCLPRLPFIRLDKEIGQKRLRCWGRQTLSATLVRNFLVCMKLSYLLALHRS